MMMQVERLSEIQQCEHIAAAWDCMARGVPFRRTAWLHSWWHHYRFSGELFVLQVSDARGEIVGIAPWYVDRSLPLGRVLRPLGNGEVGSDYLGILATAEHEQQVVVALAEWLAAAAQGTHGSDNRWDLLDLVSVDARDPLMLRFMRQLESVGNHICPRRAFSCWRIALPGSWGSYLSRLSPSHRQLVQRIDCKWLESGATRLQTVTTRKELDVAFDVLMQLHQRHEGFRHAGCSTSEAFGRFLREAVVRLLEEQLLRFHWAEMDGEPLAVALQLACGSTTYAYLDGINHDKLEHSPGQIIRVAILKRCMEERQQVFDFLHRDEQRPSQWGAQEHLCRDFSVVPPRHTAQLRHQVWLAGDTMRHWVKAGLQMAGSY